MQIITSDKKSMFQLRIKNDPYFSLALLITIAVIILFVVFPLYKVICYPGIKDYLAFFAQSRWLEATWHSLFITILTTLSTTLCGFLFAYGMARVRIFGKRFWDMVAILPILSPPFVVAISYIMLFGNRGLITYKLFGLELDIYGWHGLWLVQTVTFFPYAYLMIKNVLNSISPNLEYAAQNIGVSRFRVFRNVILPLARPGLAGAALLAAISVLADFGNPIIIAGNYTVLPSEAYMQIVGWYNLPTAAVLAMALIVPTAVLFIIQQYWVNRRVYITIAGKSSSLQKLNPSVFEKWFFNIFCFLFGGLIVLIYGTLFWGGFSKVWGVDWSPTLNNFKAVFSHYQAIINSVTFSLAASFLCAVFSMTTAYLIQRRKFALWSDFYGDVTGGYPGDIPGHRIYFRF